MENASRHIPSGLGRKWVTPGAVLGELPGGCGDQAQEGTRALSPGASLVRGTVASSSMLVYCHRRTRAPRTLCLCSGVPCHGVPPRARAAASSPANGGSPPALGGSEFCPRARVSVGVVVQAGWEGPAELVMGSHKPWDHPVPTCPCPEAPALRAPLSPEGRIDVGLRPALLPWGCPPASWPHMSLGSGSLHLLHGLVPPHPPASSTTPSPRPAPASSSHSRSRAPGASPFFPPRPAGWRGGPRARTELQTRVVSGRKRRRRKQ